MSSFWPIRSLDELCQFENGDRGKNYPGRKTFVENGVPFINAGHLENGKIDMGTMNFIPENRYEILGNGKVKKNDLLFCLRGSLGKFAIVENLEKGAIASSLVIVRPGEKLEVRYLARYFESRLCAEMIKKYENGAAQPNLSANSLKRFEIAVPPIEEQKRIVAILDEAFAGIDTAIANTQKNLANARELFESYLEKLFSDRGEGWQEKPLQDVVEVISGHSFKSQDFSPNNEAQSIKIANVGVGEFVVDSESKLPKEFVSKHSKFSIPSGCIVVALTRSVISDGFKVCVVPDEFNGALLNQRVAGLKTHEDPNLRKYLFFFLRTSSVIEYVKKMANTLMQPNLSITDLKNLPTPIAPDDVKIRIVEELEALSVEIVRLEQIYRKKLDSLIELKQSLLQKAFSGELTSNVDQIMEEAVA